MHVVEDLQQVPQLLFLQVQKLVIFLVEENRGRLCLELGRKESLDFVDLTNELREEVVFGQLEILVGQKFHQILRLLVLVHYLDLIEPLLPVSLLLGGNQQTGHALEERFVVNLEVLHGPLYCFILVFNKINTLGFLSYFHY